MYISLLILYCLQKINGERTIYSIYHLLKGKKSSQTIQDAHLYQISNLFQTYPLLRRGTFNELILGLEKDGLIQFTDVEKYKITEKGNRFLLNGMKQKPIPSFLNGWKYNGVQDDIWRRFSLFIQVVSNLIHFETSYIPIHNDTKISDWLKTILIKLNKKREVLASELLQELDNCFTKNDNIKPEVIVWRLTGHKQIGLTPTQTAEMLEMDSSYFQLEFLNTLHFFIMEIMDNRMEYPILSTLLEGLQSPIVLTKSSLATYRYLNLGYSMEEISTIRKLKPSTIEDHIVEIALNDTNFKIDPFVAIETKNLINFTIERLKTKQLKTIRQELDGRVSYFQIRLVLAKYGD